MSKKLQKKSKRKTKSSDRKIGGIFKLLWSVATVKQKWKFFFLMLLGVISAVAVLIPTQILSVIISKLSGETVYILGIELPKSIDYVTIILAGAVITFLMRTISSLYDLSIEKLIKKLVANLRIENYNWLVTPRKNMDLKMTQGDAVYRLNQAPDQISDLMCDFFENIVIDVLTSLLAFIYILLMDWQSLPILCAGLVIVIICVLVRTRIERNISFRTERAKSSMSSTIANSITNLPLITLYKSMAYESSIFQRRVENHYVEQKKQINLRLCYWFFVRFAQVGTTFLIIYLCAKRIYVGTMIVGNIVIITNYVAQIFTPIQTIGTFTARWIQCSVSVSRLYELKPEMRNVLPVTSKIDEKINSIELSHVCAENSENFAVKNINAKFNVGELTVISGESGSGKSTLIKLICGLCEKTSGDIIINNEKKLSSAYLLIDRVSLSMQDAYIFNRDVCLNVLYPDGNIRKQDYAPVVKELSLERVMKRKYDDGIEHNLENMLSGGEKKRIGISRALIKKADIYIFDEPTNDLDNNNAEKVIKSIQKLKDDAIVIIVSHDDRVKKVAEQMLVFKEPGKMEKVK